GGVPITLDGRSALKIANTNDTPLQLQLLKISKPSISKKLYAIKGEIKYENVQGDGYLEMWNFFPPLNPGMPEGQYFSRTLGIGGGTLGCLGSLLAWLAWKGLARRFVVVAAWLLIGLGVVSGLAGVVALTLNQPYLVWFPLLLGAALLLGIIPFRLRSYLKHYEYLE